MVGKKLAFSTIFFHPYSLVALPKDICPLFSSACIPDYFSPGCLSISLFYSHFYIIMSIWTQLVS